MHADGAGSVLPQQGHPQWELEALHTVQPSHGDSSVWPLSAYLPPTNSIQLNIPKLKLVSPVPIHVHIADKPS